MGGGKGWFYFFWFVEGDKMKGLGRGGKGRVGACVLVCMFVCVFFPLAGVCGV